MRPLLAALVVVGFSGCGRGIAPVLEEGTGVVTVAEPRASTRERLADEPTAFRISPLDALGSFSARRVLSNTSFTLPLAVRDGWFEATALDDAGAGHRLAVTRFAAGLEDVTFTAQQLPPNGLTLTRVSFELAEPAVLDVRWFGGGNLGWAKGTLTVNIHTWLKLSTGGESPLEVARLQVPVELTVSQTANGLLGLWVGVARSGALWSWADLFELGGLDLSLEAFEVRGPDQLPPGVELN